MNYIYLQRTTPLKSREHKRSGFFNVETDAQCAEEQCGKAQCGKA